jgi:hypothetical protein
MASVEAAAIVHALTGESSYAERSEALLLSRGGFAELFGAVRSDTYDFGCNSLLTGHQLPHLCAAVDLLWEALSDEARTHAVDRLVRSAVRHLRTHDRRDSNWQTAHSAGLLAAGLLLEDPDLVAFALDDPDHGLRRHMRVAFRTDGLHWEGSFGYHGGTLSSLLLAAEMARNAGIDLYAEGDGTPFIRRMLDVPIRMAFPDGALPVNNDSGGMTLAGMAAFYELGYARYRDPSYAWIVDRSDRSSTHALLCGEEELRTAPPDSRSLRLDQSGWAILKGIEGPGYWGSDALVAVLDYGPHGDWHGHPDKLGIEVHAGGRCWIQNSGSPVGYHGQEHWEYYRRTLAHNTVVVDGRDQRFERARDDAIRDLARTGRLLSFSPDGPEKKVSAVVDWAYEGVRCGRTLTLRGDALIDEFEVASDEPHTYDYVLHGRGIVEADLPGMARARLPETEGGYEYLIQTSRGSGEKDWRVRFRDGGWPDGRFVPDGKGFEVEGTGEPDTEVWVGYGPSRYRGVRIPFLLVRRRARRTTFRVRMENSQNP